MNIAFTRLLKMEGLLREVNFRKQPGAASAFHVDTTDERGTRFMFLVQENEDRSWTFTSPDLPQWIQKAAPLISSAIADEIARVETPKKSA